ncbi:MAG: efflux RND transporter periplasmic adaptor subunit [Bacteroidales bacterium]|nr:efflux RND transporter periplasmic adaptor subunit [Bacteroidales bacterium]
MNKFFSTIILISLLAACSNSQNQESQKENGVVISSDTIVVDPTSSVASHLVVEVVSDTFYSRSITTTGVVSAIPSCYAQVAAPFGGRVVRSLVTIGQVVKKGTPLFEISSSDYSEVVKNYLQSQSELALAKKNLTRTKDLHDNKVSSDKDLDEVQLAYNQALEEFNHAKAVAQEYQMDLTHAEVGRPMVVRSPIAGRVLQNDLVVGEYLKEDADAQIIVADLAKVWVKANINENDALLLDGVTDAEVCLVAAPDSAIAGKVVYLGGMLDAETRTVQTLVECANIRGKMMPNMYANVMLRARGHNCVIVPKGAVLQGEGIRYVLVQTDEHKYERRQVMVESVDTQHYVVLSGLRSGERIIAQGAYYLVDNK